MAVANGMRSVANARPTLCDMLPKELDTEIPAKPRRSISRAVSSVARRRPGSAIRLRAGKAAGIGRCSFISRYRADHSSCRPRALPQDEYSGSEDGRIADHRGRRPGVVTADRVATEL